jgi:predicted O-methyltransferase YrrM
MTLFTTDWFSHNIPNFLNINNYYKRNNWPINSVLEIGSHEGRSTCWMLENMISDTGSITCIDPFIGTDTDEFGFSKFDSAITGTEARFAANITEVKRSGQTVNVVTDRSFKALAQEIVDEAQYDFIYVDGAHYSSSVLADACMSFPLLKKGGIILFDDYLWDHVEDHLDRTKMGIDAFVNMFAKKVQVVFINYQLAVIKL